MKESLCDDFMNPKKVLYPFFCMQMIICPGNVISIHGQ